MPDLDTGKYAAFIWPAYGITAAVFAVLIVGALAHARHWKRRAQELSGKPGADR